MGWKGEVGQGWQGGGLRGGRVGVQRWQGGLGSGVRAGGGGLGVAGRGGVRGGRVGVQRWQGGLGSGDRAVWGGFRDGRAGWGQGRVG